MSAIAGRVLLIPKGNYDSTATYTMLDMVVYNSSSYICKQECTGVVPTNTTYWMLNASGSAVAYINDIGDVVITNPTNGQVLKYNSTSQKWENADEKGGILPHLIVISETGSTVTATKGQTVITATETSTGHFECDLPEFGTWTIDAILGGDDAQVSLVVDTVKVYTVDDSHFHATVTVKYPDGATCRLQSADETLYATGSPYTFTVHHKETYTITVTYNQRIYTDTVTFTTEGQSFTKTLPSPSEVDANDINWWLFFGGVSGTFSTLADILADSTALATLMASTDAVDYLVRCTNWISDICGNQSAMSYIGLNNYCANTLLADADWLDGICNSKYFESVLNVKVPTMTSNTTPIGAVTCSTQSNWNGYVHYAYKAFNGYGGAEADSWGVEKDVGGVGWVAYEFPQNVKIYKIHYKNYLTNARPTTGAFQAYNSSTTQWEDISAADLSAIQNTAEHDWCIPSGTRKTSKIKMNITGNGISGDDQNWIVVDELQFYGRAAN